MIGNDIVYLHSGVYNDRIAGSRFKTKFLNAQELELFSSGDPEVYLLWMIWSVKEAVFKCCKRTENQLKFNPTRITVFSIFSNTDKQPNPEFNPDRLEGMGTDRLYSINCRIKYLSHIFYSSSLVTNRFIHTIACADETSFKSAFWGVKKMNHTDYSLQSQEVRKYLADAICSNEPSLSSGYFHFSKDEFFIPELYINQMKSNLVFSLSHDHHYLAYSYLGPVSGDNSPRHQARMISINPATMNPG